MFWGFKNILLSISHVYKGNFNLNYFKTNYF